MSEPDLTRSKAIWKAVTCRDMVSLTQARRRRSLQDTQQNGGRRYTAREFHMRELKEAQESRGNVGLVAANANKTSNEPGEA